MVQYRNQKLALEEASRQLNFKNSNPEISTIRPGGVFTGRGDPSTKANVDVGQECHRYIHTARKHLHQ